MSVSLLRILVENFDIFMATIKVIYRETSKGSGVGTLFYRIIHKRKSRQIHTGYRVERDEWIGESESFIVNSENCRSEFLKSAHCNLQLGKTKFRKVIASLDKSKIEYSVDDVVEKFLTPDAVTGFLSYARNLISDLKQMGKTRCAEHYTATLNSFMRFKGNDEVPFEEFDSNLMQRYECYLKNNGLIPNSISYYMRNLRAIYNKAVEDDLTEQANPFKHVYTGIARTVKRAVSLQTIKALHGLDLRMDPLSELARDLFLFSFFTRGMAIVDMAYLRKNNLKDGTLTYRRHKTNRQLSIKWEPLMQKIVDKHINKDSDFMFPLIDSQKPDYRKQYLKAYTKLNRHLKSVGKHIGLTNSLTFHRSRHSWASIAMENNVPLSVICEGMGHDSEKTTRIYLADIDSSVVDKANSDILKLFVK